MTPNCTPNLSSDPTVTGPVVVSSRNASNTPIRFPHIPDRNITPPQSATRRQGSGTSSGASHRVDSNHPRPAVSTGAIPGIRTGETAEGKAGGVQQVSAAALPATQSDKPLQYSRELSALSEQMRRRLMDFGNLLSMRNEDPRIEKAFETVCQSFSQLQSVVERIHQPGEKSGRESV